MTKWRLLSLSATMIVAALLCSSVLATIHLAAATEVNASAPAQTQNISTIVDPQSQTPTIPLVPFQLIVANQTVSEPTSSNASATIGASQTGEAPTVAPSADPAAANAANPADAVTTNVTQPAANNGSLAPIPISAGGGGSDLILLLSLSYGTAIVVLALMRYWSFSFAEGEELPPDLNNADIVYVPGSAYSTLENVEYRQATEGP